jgi:hypothetical protein
MRTRIPDLRTCAGLIALLASTACTGGGAAEPPSSAPPAPVAAGAAAALPAGHPPIGGPIEGAVSGTVSVVPALAGAARDGRALFLIARAGPDRPIGAVKRRDALAFPLSFELSPQDAISHGTPFAGPLAITARLSRSGVAAAAAGDLEGVAAGVAPGAHDVRIELRSVRP